MHSNQLSQLFALSAIASPLAVQANVKEPIQFEETSSIRASERRMKHLLSAQTQEIPMGQFVGELQEKWQFPSDHLPIAMTLDGHHILSWNVLDAAYMSWVIETDSQGIKRSLISDEHIYLEGTNLTVRDVHIADMVIQAINHPTYPKSIVALQECSQAFLEHLKTKLPENFALRGGGNAVLIDTSKFEILSEQKIFGIFSKDKRPVNEVLLSNLETGENYRLINTHLPGDPNGPARFEFGQYLANTHVSDVVTIALGDMNFNELEMKEAMQKSGADFTMFSPYCTNISTTSSEVPFVSKAIDHFIILGDLQNRVSVIQDPEKAMEGLQKMYDLLMSSLGEQRSTLQQAG